MTKVAMLKDKVERSGLKKTFIASQLGLSLQGYLPKESGRREFTASEVGMLKQLLSLSDTEVRLIFFASEVDE